MRTPVPQQAATFALKDVLAHGVRLRQEGLAQGLLAGYSDGTRLPALHLVYATCGLLAGAGVALGRAALEAARPVVPSSSVLTSPALPSAWTGGGVQLRAAVAGAALYHALYFGIHDAVEVGGGTRTARAPCAAGTSAYIAVPVFRNALITVGLVKGLVVGCEVHFLFHSFGGVPSLLSLPLLLGPLFD